MFVTFDKYLAPELGPDFLERVGNLLLYPITRGFGSLISVKTVGKMRFPCFSEKTISLCKRIFYVVCNILAAPITCLLALSGLISYKLSSTYQNTKNLFKNYLKDCLQSQDFFQKNLLPVITLQKHLRGYVIKKPLVNRKMFPEYKKICEAILNGDLEGILFTEKMGDPVYCSKEIPSLLLKKIGANKAKQHVRNNIALSLCLSKIGVDSLQVLPASTYKDFLIEEKPFGKGALDTLVAYRLNPSLFDQAIKSLCKLFSFYHFPELFMKTSDQVKDIPYIKLLLGFKESFKKEELHANQTSLHPILYLTGIEHIIEEPTPFLEEKLIELFPYHKKLIQTEIKKPQPFSDKQKLPLNPLTSTFCRC